MGYVGFGLVVLAVVGAHALGRQIGYSQGYMDAPAVAEARRARQEAAEAMIMGRPDPGADICRRIIDAIDDYRAAMGPESS